MGSYSFGTTVCAWPAMLDVVNSASDQRLHPPWWPHEPERVPVTCSLADCTDTLCSKGNDYLSKRHLARHFLDAVAARREQLGSHDYDQQANFLFTFQQSAIFTSKVKKCDSFFFASDVVASASVFVAAIWHKTMTISKAMLLIRCTAIDRVCTNDTTHNNHLTAAARAERFLNTNNSIWMKMVNKLISTSKETNISQRVSIDCLQELLQLVDGVVERRRDELSNCSAN